MSLQESTPPTAADSLQKVNRDVLRALQPGALYFALLGVCLIDIYSSSCSSIPTSRHARQG